MSDYLILKTKKSKDYELLDSGEGEKLERYGKFIVSRPDPQALWPKLLAKKDWQEADAIFTRAETDAKWEFKKDFKESWQIDFGGLKLLIKPTAFKHLGIFPEQQSNWEWMFDLITKEKREISVINLFGYTGAASLVCAKAKASVCHVDSSKTAVEWAKENAKLSKLEDKPIRWIVEDVRKYLQREIKRGKKYDGIIMDPPAFGHGPNKELWKIEKHFLELMDLAKQVLSDDPLFFLINGYSAGYSAIAYENNLLEIHKKLEGNIEIGELALEESKSKRLLPCGIFSRWSCK